MTNSFRLPILLAVSMYRTNKSDIHMKSGLWSVAVPMEYMTSVLFRKEADSDPISTDGKILAD